MQIDAAGKGGPPAVLTVSCYAGPKLLDRPCSFGELRLEGVNQLESTNLVKDHVLSENAFERQCSCLPTLVGVKGREIRAREKDFVSTVRVPEK